MYTVYKPEELIKKLDLLEDEHEDVIKFFNNISYNDIVKQDFAKKNSLYVFKNIKNDNPIKSKIISELNKLNSQTLQKVISSITDIIITKEEDVNELFNQCIQKIKRDNEQIRPLVAALCNVLVERYIPTDIGETVKFKKVFIKKVKNEYEESVNYSSENWTKEKGEKVMILLGTLYNSKTLNDSIMISIINDFKKKIFYKEDGNQEYYEEVEKSLQQLSCLLSCIILNEETKKIYNDLQLDKFLEDQMLIYEEKKCISKKIRLVCKTTIQELRKIF